jgi:glycosyltransferase involved in cell wall biosynthesis
MSVTVVIPSRGISPDLRASVDSALRAAIAAGDDAEVLVVVNGRMDAPALAGIDAPQLRVLHLEQANLSRARNVGIAEARHDTILFGDDGARAAASWCVEVSAGLRDPRYPVVTGPVRVPVLGPVTAYLNHQRVFDAPPLDVDRARTVTGFCGIRRDRLPSSLRYDETNLPYVGEDVAFGHAVRAAGFEIGWLGAVPPGLHMLPDRLEEITDRMFRYGRATAGIWERDGAVIPPADVAAVYAYLGSDRYQAYRRFAEVSDAGTRAAFVVYDFLYDLSFLVGYLDGLSGRPLIALDAAGLRQAWLDVADRAAATAMDVRNQASLVDFARLDRAISTPEPLIDEVKASLLRYAPLLAHSLAPPTPVRLPPPGGGEPEADHDGLQQAWRRLRDAGNPIGVDVLDRTARGLGHAFRDACVAIERAEIRTRFVMAT